MRRTFLTLLAALLAAVSIVGCGGNAAPTPTPSVSAPRAPTRPFSYQGTDGKLTGYDVEVTTGRRRASSA